MSKSRIFKISGFIATLATGALMVGTAVTGTGAYFSDSHRGSITADAGHLRLGITDNSDLSFPGLMPAVDKTQSIPFSVDVTDGTADVWLVFDPESVGYQAWTGPKDSTVVVGGGLGRYGHVKISTDASGSLFESYNMALAPGGDTTSSCPTNAFGQGGSTQKATSPTDTPPYCGVPAAILIAKDMTTASAQRTLNVTFGITAKATGQDVSVANVPFHIVATESGIRPGTVGF